MWLFVLYYAGSEYLIGQESCVLTWQGERQPVSGGLPDITLTDLLAGPGDTQLAPSLSLSVLLPEDIPLRVSQGFPLSGARAELYWVPATGPAVLRLSGRLRSPDYGARGEPVSFTVENQGYQATRILPGETLRVDGYTWPNSILTLTEVSAGGIYPLVIGRPGVRGDGSNTSGSPARWAWHNPDIPGGSYTNYVGLILVIAGHHVSCERVYIWTEAAEASWRAPVVNGYDGRGQPIAFIPWYATKSGTEEPYDYDPAGSYASALLDFDGDYTYGLGSRNVLPDGNAVSVYTTASAEPQFWVAFRDDESDGRGGMTEGGELLQGAGRVLAVLLALAGQPVDPGSVRANSAYLDRFLLDFAISESCSLWEFLLAHLFPILPVSLLPLADGWSLAVWRWDGVASEARLALEAGPDCSRLSTVSEDSSQVCNRFRLQYARRLSSGKYAEEVSLSGDLPDPEEPDREFSEVCRRSVSLYGETSESLITSDVIYDRSTALAVLRAKALALALARIRIRYQVPTSKIIQLSPGALVLITDRDFYWESKLFLLESISYKGAVSEISLIASI